MLELYFLFIWIPKKMGRLARERNRSRMAWSLAGVGGWIGGEVVVFVIAGTIHGLGIAFWGWPEEEPGGIVLLLYVAALAAALVGFAIVRRILISLPVVGETPELPPPPPRFGDYVK